MLPIPNAGVTAQRNNMIEFWRRRLVSCNLRHLSTSVTLKSSVGNKRKTDGS